MKKIILNFFLILLFFSSIFLALYFWRLPHKQEFIYVGILHSLTGTMGSVESTTVDATLLAIDQVNERGGVLGKKIKPIIFDGQSDSLTFAKGAEKLITEDKVSVIFGCCTSASRKAVLPILEKYDHLLFYPIQYEGLEESPYVIYTGATCNQHSTPGVIWSFQNLGKKFFLIGSDYIFPRASHEINKEVIRSLGGTVVGEEYIPLGSEDVDHIVEKIIETKPEVILNILVSESNIPFFKKLRIAGITSEKIPTMSFTFAELELQNLDSSSMIGDYAALSYFQSIDTDQNREFVQEIKKKFGKNLVVSYYMDAAFFGVHLWSQTVNEAKSTSTKEVREHVKNQSYNAPEGIVSIDQNNQHTWRTARIGKIQSNGQFNIIWTSDKPIPPVPYPLEYRSKEDWDQFLNNSYVGWGQKWSVN